MKPDASPPRPTADANSPLLGRVFEARAEAEMSSMLEQHANDECAALQCAREVDESGASRRTAVSDEPLLPFLGTVLEHIPGTSITIERRLDLDEDLYLPDHSLVFAPGVKPMSACLPVMPMTMSLEAMAEVAACLAEGQGLLGFEDVTAARWIELADTDSLTLHIAARFDRLDPERGVSHVAVAIHVAGQTSPAIHATVLFGEHYQVGLTPAFSELTNAHPYVLDAEQLYAERHMFHGPSFRSLVGEIIIGDQGLAGELIVLPPENLFRSTSRPQLLTYPTLLDAIGQLMGVWALEHDRFAFPIGLAKLEIYCPTPPVGTRTRVRVQMTQSEGKTLIANVEVEDSSGGVWMRIEGWRSWKFRWEQRFVDFRRLPHRFLLGEAAPALDLDDGSVLLTLNGGELGNSDFTMLARYCLSMEEMATFKSHDGNPKRQQQWLLGRVVAKDAVRLWAAEQTGETTRLHPASFTIESDAQSRPFVRALPTGDTPPHVSIAHCETRALAIAHSEPVGVDIERIAAREHAFIEVFTTPRERALLEAFPAAELDAWITRLWCAKEAVGKLLGVGMSAPRTLESIVADENGRIQIRHHESARTFTVVTVRDAEFIAACTRQSASDKRDGVVEH